MAGNELCGHLIFTLIVSRSMMRWNSDSNNGTSILILLSRNYVFMYINEKTSVTIYINIYKIHQNYLVTLYIENTKQEIFKWNYDLPNYDLSMW